MRMIGRSSRLAKSHRALGRALFSSLAALALCCAAGAQAQAQETSQANVGWDYLGGGDSSQYSPLDQIDKSNVKDLEVAWTFEAGVDPPGAFGFRQQHVRLVRQHCEPHSCAEPSRAVKAAAGDTPSSAAISQTLIAFRMPVIRRMSAIGSPPHNLCGPRVD